MITISGQNPTSVFEIGTASQPASAAISGLTIVSGQSSGGGGGVLVNGGSRLAVVASVWPVHRPAGAGIYNLGITTVVVAF